VKLSVPVGGVTRIGAGLLRRLGWGGAGALLGAIPSAVVEWHFVVAPVAASPVAQFCGTGTMEAEGHALLVITLGTVMGALASNGLRFLIGKRYAEQ
jgi:hypothetical protein